MLFYNLISYTSYVYNIFESLTVSPGFPPSSYSTFTVGSVGIGGQLIHLDNPAYPLCPFRESHIRVFYSYSLRVLYNLYNKSHIKRQYLYEDM